MTGTPKESTRMHINTHACGAYPSTRPRTHPPTHTSTRKSPRGGPDQWLRGQVGTVTRTETHRHGFINRVRVFVAFGFGGQEKVFDNTDPATNWQRLLEKVNSHPAPAPGPAPAAPNMRRQLSDQGRELFQESIRDAAPPALGMTASAPGVLSCVCVCVFLS